MTPTLASSVARHLGTKPAEGSVRPWLAGLRDQFVSAETVPPAVIADLIDRARPRWGVKSVDDGAAYVEFWAELTARWPEPALLAAFADVLYLVGPSERAREALQTFFAAVRRQPALFVDYAGDFSDLAEKLGEQRDYTLATVTFYAYLVDRGEMDESDLRDSVRDLLDRFGSDPTVRPALQAIAHGSLRGGAGLG